MSQRTPYVTPWTWNRGKPEEVDGAIIRTGARAAFIPEADLRRIADLLHDIADDLEEKEQ